MKSWLKAPSLKQERSVRKLLKENDMWRILLLLAWFTPDGKVIIKRVIKFFAFLVLIVIGVMKFMMWWLYTPDSPGYNQEAMNQVHEMDRIDEKRKACDNIAPANWDDECRKLSMRK
jgi:hypothetical protein